MTSLWPRNFALTLIAILLSYVFLQLPEQKTARQQCLEWKEEMQTRGVIDQHPACRSR